MATSAPLMQAQAIADMNASVCSMLANVVASINGAPVSALFSNASRFTSYDGQIGYEHSKPMLTLASANVPGAPVGLSVTVGADNYTIFAHEPDGAGLSRLILERA